MSMDLGDDFYQKMSLICQSNPSLQAFWLERNWTFHQSIIDQHRLLGAYRKLRNLDDASALFETLSDGHFIPGAAIRNANVSAYVRFFETTLSLPPFAPIFKLGTCTNTSTLNVFRELHRTA